MPFQDDILFSFIRRHGIPKGNTILFQRPEKTVRMLLCHTRLIQ